MEFRVAPVRPRKRFRTLTMAFAMVLAAVPAATVADLVRPDTGAVQDAEAVTYGPWSAWKYIAIPRGPGSRDDECDLAAAARAKFIGPVQYTHKCVQAIRYRKGNANHTTWVDKWVEIENVGPHGLYGQRMKVLVSVNGTIIKAQAPICSEFAALVTITRQTCSITGSGTGTLVARMDYKVSWTFLWMNVQAGRGAQITIKGNGDIVSLIKWP